MNDLIEAQPHVSYEEFYRSNYRRVLALGVALCGGRGPAEDLTQDAFLAAYRDWTRISGYDDPLAWVRRVVVNRSVSRARRRISEYRALARLGGGRQPEIELSPSTRDFWDAVRALPRRQAQVVALFYVADATVADIAMTLDVAEGTVKAHLHAARQALSAQLGLEVSE